MGTQLRESVLSLILKRQAYNVAITGIPGWHVVYRITLQENNVIFRLITTSTLAQLFYGCLPDTEATQ
jgi:hypothetical protein